MIPATALLPVACTSGSAEREHAEDAALIVPERLTVSALAGGNGVFELVALTLRQGPSRPELYASLKNTGDTPACSAGFSVELFDEAGQSLASGIGGLLTQRFYRLADGSGAIAACVAPSEVTMAALTDLPSDLAIEHVTDVVYRCPYFALDVVPIGDLAIGPMESVTRGSGTAYTGTLVNGLDVELRNPSVLVFPVNRAGRPLGVATGSDAVVIPPGGRWAFETDAVDTASADYVAYPAGALAK